MRIGHVHLIDKNNQAFLRPLNLTSSLDTAPATNTAAACNMHHRLQP
jgi:hypothetical protein